MTASNNVTRMLEAKKVKFEAFEIPAEKLSALEVAELLKVDPFSVFKTIVVKRGKPGKPILAIVPGPLEVDLKKLAGAVNEKKVFIPTMKEAEDLTGLLAGGISALALVNKGFQVLHHTLEFFGLCPDCHAAGVTPEPPVDPGEETPGRRPIGNSLKGDGIL